MGFSFRKSVKIGPVRLNASKSGLGVSVGVKGARIGVNSKGKVYGSAGANGLYYRTQLSPAKRKKSVGKQASDIQPMPEIEPEVGIFGGGIVLVIVSVCISNVFPTGGVVGAVIGGLCVIGAIVAGIQKKRKNQKKDEPEMADDGADYADTLRLHIVQDGKLSPDELDALITEYCGLKKLSPREQLAIADALRAERADFLKK